MNFSKKEVLILKLVKLIHQIVIWELKILFQKIKLRTEMKDSQNKWKTK